MKRDVLQCRGGLKSINFVQVYFSTRGVYRKLHTFELQCFTIYNFIIIGNILIIFDFLNLSMFLIAK